MATNLSEDLINKITQHIKLLNEKQLIKFYNKMIKPKQIKQVDIKDLSINLPKNIIRNKIRDHNIVDNIFKFLDDDKPSIYREIAKEDYIKNKDILNSFNKYYKNEKCSFDIRLVADEINNGYTIMGEQVLIINFDLSEYDILDELIENKINVKYCYQSVFKEFEGRDVIISRQNNIIKFKKDVGECDLNRFNSLQIYFTIYRESLI
jgi:hypothetical protein